MLTLCHHQLFSHQYSVVTFLWRFSLSSQFPEYHPMFLCVVNISWTQNTIPCSVLLIFLGLRIPSHVSVLLIFLGLRIPSMFLCVINISWTQNTIPCFFVLLIFLGLRIPSMFLCVINISWTQNTIPCFFVLLIFLGLRIPSHVSLCY